MGNKLGFAIPFGVFDVGLHICHVGSIVVNGNAKVGKNCTLHGNNKDSNEKVSFTSDNVEFGFGSSVFGKVFIAKNCVIGGHAFIVKDIIDENTTWISNTARLLSKSN